MSAAVEINLLRGEVAELRTLLLQINNVLKSGGLAVPLEPGAPPLPPAPEGVPSVQEIAAAMAVGDFSFNPARLKNYGKRVRKRKTNRINK